MSQAREAYLQDVEKNVITEIHQKLTAAELSQAEYALVWLNIMAAMLESIRHVARATVYKSWLKKGERET